MSPYVAGSALRHAFDGFRTLAQGSLGTWDVRRWVLERKMKPTPLPRLIRIVRGLINSTVNLEPEITTLGELLAHFDRALEQLKRWPWEADAQEMFRHYVDKDVDAPDFFLRLGQMRVESLAKWGFDEEMLRLSIDMDRDHLKELIDILGTDFSIDRLFRN